MAQGTAKRKPKTDTSRVEHPEPVKIGKCSIPAAYFEGGGDDDDQAVLVTRYWWSEGQTVSDVRTLYHISCVPEDGGCGYCEYTLTFNARYCPHCGRELDDTQYRVEARTTPQLWGVMTPYHHKAHEAEKFMATIPDERPSRR